VIWIEDPEDSRVQNYQLRKHKEESSPYFVCDHEKTVVRLLDSQLETVSVLGTQPYLTKHKDLLDAKQIPEDRRFVMREETFHQTIGFAVHRGFLALGKKPENKKPEELSFPIVVCEGIVDAENLGSVFRTGTALGWKSFVLDGRSSPPYLRRTVRVSMGAVFRSEIAVVEDLHAVLATWKAGGRRIAGLCLPKEGEETWELGRETQASQPPDVLLLGNEAEGLREGTRALCTSLLTIPMQEEVDSLNVSQALAVALGAWLGKTA